MTPLSLSLAFFKSFRAKQVFVFPTEPGLYLLTGKNKLNPELSSNAIGKSSLFDALCWCLYGKTSRGLSAGNIKCWDADGQTKVSFNFHKDGNRYRISRTQSPNSLTLRINGGTPATVTQDAIDGVIGYGYDQFLSTVLMSQFGTFFFDLGATEKLKVFSDILNLGYWSEKAKRAGELENGAIAETETLKLSLNTVTAQIEMLRGQLSDERVRASEFTLDRKKRLADISKKAEAAELELGFAKDTYQAAREARIAGEPEQKKNDLEERLREAIRAADYEEMNLTAARRGLKETEEKITALRRSDKCPTCGTVLNNEHSLKEEEKLKVVRKSWADKVEEFGKSFANAGGLSEKLKELAARQKAKQQKVNDTFRGLQDAETKSKIKFADAVRDKEELQKGYDRIKAEKNIHEENIGAIRGKLSKVKVDAELTKEKLDVALERATSFAYWKKEFGNLRLWLISESLVQLSTEINNSLMMLGLRGWKIAFDIEKVTKAGTVSRGFSTFILPPGGAERIDWRSFSGGECTRLRVAGACGLASLIRARMGITTPLEIFDEPASYLSTEGVDDVITFLKDRADTERRAIILIAHGVSSAGDFDGKFEINRTKAGSLLSASV